MAYELLPTGRIFLKTAFFDNENNIDSWITKSGTSKDLMSLEAKERGDAASMLTGHPSRTTNVADSLTPSVVQPLSFFMIQERIGIVKQKDIFNQRAWVGLAANFDKFDLGYVGTGEGAQVHGYGLYSAQGRNMAEGYKEKLSALLNEAEGDPVDYNYIEVIQFNGYRYEKPEGYDLWTFEPGTADEAYIDDPGEDAVLEKLNEVQDVDKVRAGAGDCGRARGG